MPNKYDFPDLSNATPSFLIDEVGRLKEEASRIEAFIKYHRARLDSLQPPEQNGEGELFFKAVTLVTQTKVNLERAVSFLTEEELAQCRYETSFTQTRFPRK